MEGSRAGSCSERCSCWRASVSCKLRSGRCGVRPGWTDGRRAGCARRPSTRRQGSDAAACSPRPPLTRDLHGTKYRLHAEARRPRHDHMPTIDRRLRSALQVQLRTRVFFGDRVDLAVRRWTTAHADLHGANLFEPDGVLVDWEGCGYAPAGYDVATVAPLPIRASGPTRTTGAIRRRHDRWRSIR
ncbi:phosphotransferase [Amycolatopsis sp. H6(2020)]|nr:phosphotransferase [Amycolatopsis sp. H6(2020)]